MNDFTSVSEEQTFALLGRVPKKVDPLNHIDQYSQGVALGDIGANPCEYGAMMERFQKTFRPDAKAPAGGEVLYSISC